MFDMIKKGLAVFDIALPKSMRTSVRECTPMWEVDGCKTPQEFMKKASIGGQSWIHDIVPS